MDRSGNKRDRSEEAETRRIERSHVIDFTGWNGLMRSLVSFKSVTLFKKKPKRGWAAKHRKAPLADFFPPERMEAARMRHVHPRHLRHSA